MKRITLILFFVSSAFIGQLQAQILKESQYFSFHSNTWINLHHFLYQQAKGDQLAHLQEDGNTLIDIGDSAIIQSLNSSERKVFDEAVNYYCLLYTSPSPRDS